MMNNPEFRRNLWLELSPYRLIGMPAVLGAVIYLVSLLNTGDAAVLAPITLALFSVIVFLWGTRQASEAVVAEVRDRTWDQQRMSSIGPWSMTWGKLLGSTIYPWYGGLLCLAAYAILTAGLPAERPAVNAALFVVCGLISHAVALLSSMQALKKDRTYHRSQAAAYLILGVIVTGPVLSMAFQPALSVKWFNAQYEGSSFFLAVTAVFLGWTVTGIYRLMRTELQIKNGPFVWLAFVCFLSLFFAGFANHTDPRELLFNRLVVAGMVSALLTYAMALSERKDPMAFKRLIAAGDREDWRRVLHEVPCWGITLLPVFAGACGMLLTAGSFKAAAGAADIRMVVIACVLFLLRDLALLLFFNLSKNPKRADMIFILSLGLLYGVAPGILSAMQFDAMTALFWPRGDRYAVLAIAAAGIEAVLVLSLMSLRWRKQYGI
jgi:hypothetical protein